MSSNVTKESVKVFKNNIEVGWYKNLVTGINAIEATCLHIGFDVTEYELRDYATASIILWSGSENK